MFLHENSTDWQELVLRTSTRYSLEQSFVAKDYFIYLILKLIVSHNPEIVFKGGTCLSKCHHAISRFSEDIDLGIESEKATEGQRKRMKAAVLAAAAELNLAITNIDKTRSRRAFNKYLIPLPVLEESLGGDLLIVETAVMSPTSPTSIKPIDSYIYQLCCEAHFDDVIAQYNLEPFKLKVNSIERTFVDKVFAICDYYLSGNIPSRQSRHLYDLFKLSDRLSFDANLAELFTTVRSQRKGGYRCFSAENDVDIAETLDTIRESNAYQQDYETITSPLLYEKISYDDAVSSLQHIAEFVRKHEHPHNSVPTQGTR